MGESTLYHVEWSNATLKYSGNHRPGGVVEQKQIGNGDDDFEKDIDLGFAA